MINTPGTVVLAAVGVPNVVGAEPKATDI